MELLVQGSDAKVTVSDATFDRPYSEGLVHQVVTAYLAGARQGTKKTKNRSDVSGGGKKPWRQKGTGNARAGTIRSPIWRGGGHTFAFRPRDYSQKINKKQYRAGIQSIFSELVRQERLVVVEKFDVAEPKTKLFKQQLKDIDGKNILVIGDAVSENLYLAARNIPHVAVVDTDAIDPASLVGADKVVVTVDAVKKIEEWLA